MHSAQRAAEGIERDIALHETAGEPARDEFVLAISPGEETSGVIKPFGVDQHDPWQTCFLKNQSGTAFRSPVSSHRCCRVFAVLTELVTVRCDL